MKGAVPHLRVQNAPMDIGLARDFAKIKARAEMCALAMQHHGAHVVIKFSEEPAQALHGLIIKRIALLRAREAQDGDGAVARGVKG